MLNQHKMNPLNFQDKIVSLETLLSEKQHFSAQKVVFTNGCFDVLHVGHVQYLAQAKSLGDLLIIGINSDHSVKRLKGEDRPINPENARALVLAALQFVDYVVLFEEDTPYNLIAQIVPDFLVKGGDYQIKDIVGADVVQNHGGQVITIPFVEGYSSSNIIKKMNDENA
ncbi:MAG: rfaE bifunctional protein [Bacteroidetes bacterium]|nr:rfaE bifunctional protein [Bacteroidota bacterium]